MNIAWESGTVSAEWHRAPKESGTVVVLAHGAGGNMHTPQLRSFADGLMEHGISSLRFNFAYAEAGKKAPDRTATLEAVYRAAATEARTYATRLIFGGRSMGGRMGSNIAAQGEPCDGLIFLAYPLHPPGKPEKIRDAHLYEITQPMLFIQGDHDAFAEPELLAATLAKLPTATLHTVTGGDHSHKVKGRPVNDVTAELVAATVAWVTGS